MSCEKPSIRAMMPIFFVSRDVFDYIEARAKKDDIGIAEVVAILRNEALLEAKEIYESSKTSTC